MLANVEIRKNLGNFFSGNKPSNAAIRPASIELSVGEIIVPPSESNNSVKKCRDYIIPVGGTLVVKTSETLNIPADHAALMFPKSSTLAEKGILITNFGCVDPGYTGPLKFVVVNLGRAAFGIRTGDKIVTLALFKLAQDADPAYPEYAKEKPKGMSDEESVKLLSHDLVQLEQRARDAAESTVNQRIVRFSFTLALALIVPSIFIALAPPFVAPLWEGSKTDERVTVLSVRQKHEFSVLEDKLSALAARVEELEK